MLRGRRLGLADAQAEVARYYAGKIARHGAVPRGVDWPDAASQERRFAHLLAICDWTRPVRLDDLGCGYGALLDFIRARRGDRAVDYLGIDLCPAMIAAARRRFGDRPQARFVHGTASPRMADVAVASGTFNVKLDQPVDVWEDLVERTLAALKRTVRRGFAVNFLLPTAPGVGSPPELYRPAPGRWTRFCREHLGLSTEAVIDDDLGEITLLANR